MSDDVGTKSQDYTPSRLCLSACQDLSDVLRPHHPIVPEAVILDQPQNLTHALQNPISHSSSRVLRLRPKVDYFRLHHGVESDEED